LGAVLRFASEDDWFDYRLENEPRFLSQIEKACKRLRAGRGVRLEDRANGALGANHALAPFR